MDTIEVEVLSRATNNAVLKLPSRKYPGVLIQGDSLSALEELAISIEEACQAGDFEEAQDLAATLRESLTGRLAIYEEALAAHGIKLPYNPRKR